MQLHGQWVVDSCEIPGMFADGSSFGQHTIDSCTPTADQVILGSKNSTDSEELSMSLQCPPSVDEKALMRKIDNRVIPVLFIIYVAAFLDR